MKEIVKLIIYYLHMHISVMKHFLIHLDSHHCLALITYAIQVYFQLVLFDFDCLCAVVAPVVNKEAAIFHLLMGQLAVPPVWSGVCQTFSKLINTYTIRKIKAMK